MESHVTSYLHWLDWKWAYGSRHALRSKNVWVRATGEALAHDLAALRDMALHIDAPDTMTPVQRRWYDWLVAVADIYQANRGEHQWDKAAYRERIEALEMRMK